jgi:hypothetical protein
MTIFVNFLINKTRIEYRVKKEKENKLKESSVSLYLFS